MRFLPIGYEVSPEEDWNQMRQETCWTGKPWRRIELLTQRYFHKGEQVAAERTLTFHLGLRRLGLFVTFMVVRAPGFDYSDEPHV